MLDTADILIHRHPIVCRVPLDYATLIVRRAVAQKIPGRLDESVYRVVLAPRMSTAARAGSADERGMAGERRASLAADLDVMRQHDRKIFFLFGHHAARVAVDDWDRRSPVTLAADSPVAQAIIDLLLPRGARSTSQSIARRLASATVSPSRKPELILTPSPV